MKRRFITTTEPSPGRRKDVSAIHRCCKRVSLAVLVSLSAVVGSGCGSIRLEPKPPKPENPPVVVNVSTLPSVVNSFQNPFFVSPGSEFISSQDGSLPELSDGNPGSVSSNLEPIIQIRQVAQTFVNPIVESDERHFALGTVPIGAPGPNTTTEDLDQAVKRAAELAECFVLRQQVDWEAFRPGGGGPAKLTDDLVALVSKARASGFSQILLELDPITSRVAIGPLPPALIGQNFGSPAVRTALLDQTLEVVRLAQPDYLSLAVEVNGYFEAEPDDFMNFVSLHKEIYDAVKAVRPETQVLASFNLEGIQGLFQGLNALADHGPQWFLLDLFEPKVDGFAFSTLPFPVFFSAVQLPDDYLSQIQDHTDRDIVLSEVGWSTALEANSNQQQQADYLALMVRQALQLPQLRVFAWTILFDAAPGSIFDVFPAFSKLGLLEENGSPKTALSIWARLHDTPLREPQP